MFNPSPWTPSESPPGRGRAKGSRERGKMWWQIFVCDVGGVPSLGRPVDGLSDPGLQGRPQGSPLRPLLFAERRGREFFSNHRRVDLGSERTKVGWCVIQ